MPGRRRQRRTEASKIDATPPWEGRQRDEPAATTGPFDVRDAPEDEVPRVDLGALRIPVADAFDVQVNIEGQVVIAATLANGDGAMQLGVFAAPRNEGIWDEVRTEIAASLKQDVKASSVIEKDGPFGTELHAMAPEGPGRKVPVRFVGIDGPRWFVRAQFSGAIASDEAKAGVFEDALRGLVVVRGSDPLPVREPVPLQLPEGIELPGSE